MTSEYFVARKLGNLFKADFHFFKSFKLFAENAFSWLIFYCTIPTFNYPEKDTIENIVGKGENTGNQHFSPIPTMFSTQW